MQFYHVGVALDHLYRELVLHFYEPQSFLKIVSFNGPRKEKCIREDLVPNEYIFKLAHFL